MPRFGLKRMLVTFAVAAVLLGLVRLGHEATRPVYPGPVYKRLTPGLSKDGVREILGEPDEVYDDTWHYQPVWFNPGYVQIAFDNEGRLLWVNDESIYRPAPE